MRWLTLTILSNGLEIGTISILLVAETNVFISIILEYLKFEMMNFGIFFLFSINFFLLGFDQH